MRSHFLPAPGVAATCAIAGVLSMLPTNSPAQSLVAADYATNSIYAGGWSAGQNGGHGFGAWSFNGTVDAGTGTANPGDQQEMTSSSPIGRAWTLFNLGSAPASSGLSDTGRSITQAGGLRVGQTFEAIIGNPTEYHFYGGFDIMFKNGTDNSGAGDNTAALRIQVFDYFITNWKLGDGSGNTVTPLDPSTTGSAGMKLDLTLISTNTYSVTLTPLSDPSSAYTHVGTLTTNLPINYVNFRLYDGMSAGPNDTANNYEISSITISGPTLNIQQAGTNVVLSWLGALTNFALVSSSNLGAGAVWDPVSTQPSIVNGQNVVTNPITGSQQFYRLHYSP